MNEILAALTEQQAELDAILDGIDATAWAAPTRCDGWSVSDVVLHMAQTNEMALASLEHRMQAWLEEMLRDLPPTGNVDDGAGLMVDKERGAPGDAVFARWQRSVDDMNRAFGAIDPHERVQWVAGTLSAHTLSATRLSETWIHTVDAASGVGVDLAPTARLVHIARLAWRTLPYAFERAGRPAPGPIAFELTAPNGDAWVFSKGEADTVLRGAAAELCEVAAQRAAAPDTGLVATGPDAAAVLELVRTFA